MEKIKLEFSLEEVNMVLESLGKLSYEQVYQLIPKIHAQAKKQLNGNGAMPESEAIEAVQLAEQAKNQ